MFDITFYVPNQLFQLLKMPVDVVSLTGLVHSLKWFVVSPGHSRSGLHPGFCGTLPELSGHGPSDEIAVETS